MRKLVQILVIFWSLCAFTMCSDERDSEGEKVQSITEAVTVITGFTDETVVSGLSTPTAMQFAPDGRLFVTEQRGALRVIKNGVLLATPFLNLAVDSAGERGLLGVTFDPNFATNHFVYVYYTTNSPTTHNRLSRFTANGDVAVAGSEVAVLDLNTLSSATNHNGGAIHFGLDGKLYVAVGENANGSNAQNKTNLLGKILRISADGSIPSDNPFLSTTSGKNQAIWAMGLRNPFTVDIQPGSGRVFINDVGQNTWEEINDGIAGSNYGWPTTEGVTSDPSFRSPILAYDHGVGCAITGGAYYNPASQQFPSSYVGKYFYADYCGNWIKLFNPSTGGSTDFASNISAPVDLKVGADGFLYYLARGTGAVGRIRPQANSQSPSISQQPANRTIGTGQPTTFTIGALGTAPLSYQWQKNQVNIGGANSQSYTTPPATPADNGSRYRCVVTNPFGSATSAEATLTVTGNTAPTPMITAPANGGLYAAGDVITYSGTGTDTQDGTLPASAFTWQVDFGHETHFHPFIPATTGAKSGTFTIPTQGEASADSYYRIILSIKDSVGLTSTTSIDIRPRTVTLTLNSNPSGLQLKLDGQPFTTPYSVLGVIGAQRTIEAVAPQISAGQNWNFGTWSDGGAVSHTITTPSGDTSYIATFQGSGALSFQQDPGADGIISVEAEHYMANVAQGGHNWISNSSAGFSGTSALLANPDTGALINTGYTTGSARLDFSINFVKSGTYYVWVRGMGPGGSGTDDSCHVGIDGQAISTSDRISSFATGWTWSKATMDGPVATFTVSTLGIRTLNLWMREDGFIVDKIVLTTNTSYSPTGIGPGESTLSSGGALAFRQDPGVDGIVSCEAEHSSGNVSQGGHSWITTSDPRASGTALLAAPNTGARINTGYLTGSPRLDFLVNFVKTGTYYVWILGTGPSGNGDDDSCHAGIDGQAISTSNRISAFDTNWTWSKTSMDGPNATFDVSSLGLHTVNVWMREDGFIFDKIVLTSNAAYVPSGFGPPESPR